MKPHIWLDLHGWHCSRKGRRERGFGSTPAEAFHVWRNPDHFHWEILSRIARMFV